MQEHWRGSLFVWWCTGTWSQFVGVSWVSWGRLPLQASLATYIADFLCPALHTMFTSLAQLHQVHCWGLPPSYAPLTTGCFGLPAASVSLALRASSSSLAVWMVRLTTLCSWHFCGPRSNPKTLHIRHNKSSHLLSSWLLHLPGVNLQPLCLVPALFGCWAARPSIPGFIFILEEGTPF